MNGFLLTSRLQQRNYPLKDQMVFYGALETGESFQWIISNPYYIAFAEEQNKLPEHLYYKAGSGFADYRGKPYHSYVCGNGRELETYVSRNIKKRVFESHINPLNQFLVAKSIWSMVKFLDEPEWVQKSGEKNKVAVFVDPKIDVSYFQMKLRTLSIDVEMGAEDGLLYSIAVYGEDPFCHQNGGMGTQPEDNSKKDESSKTPKENKLGVFKKVYMLSDQEKIEGDVQYIKGEDKLLKIFCKEVRDFNPHVITGWYVIGFDFTFLKDKADQYDMPLALGIQSEPMELSKNIRYMDPIARVEGRVIIDGLLLARDLLKEKPANMKLETVAQFLLNEGKKIQMDGKAKVEEIIRQFYNDKPSLAAYNLQDAKITYDIVQKLQGIQYSFLRAVFSGVPLQSIFHQNEIFQRNYLRKLREKKKVSFEKHIDIPKVRGAQLNKIWEGGVYKDVFKFVFEDLYPLVIIKNHIDPFGMLALNAHEGKDWKTNVGFSFHQDYAFLSELVAQWIIRRADTAVGSVEREATDKQIQMFVNAMLYGNNPYALGGIKNAILESAHVFVNNLIEKIDDSSIAKVIYADNRQIILRKKDQMELAEGQTNEKPTQLGDDRDDMFLKRIEEITKDCFLSFFYDDLNGGKEKSQILKDFSERLKDGGGKNSLLKLIRFKKNYKYLFFDSHHLEDFSNTTFYFHGVDYQNNVSQNDLTKQTLELKVIFQEKLLNCIFEGRDIRQFISTFKEDFRLGHYDKAVFYKKKIQKPIQEYEMKTSGKPLPAHIKLALKDKSFILDLQSKGKKRIHVEYYHSETGPCLKKHADENNMRIDFQWYIQHELLPKAKEILKYTEFEDVESCLLSNNKQLNFF